MEGVDDGDKVPSFDAGEAPRRSTSSLDDTLGSRLRFLSKSQSRHLRERQIMKIFVALMVMAVGAFTQAVALPSGWIRSITIASISDNDIDGEVVQLTVNEVVENPAHCADSTG